MISIALVFQLLFLVAIVLSVIFGNALILLAVRFSKVFTDVTRHLIGHIAVADMLFGLVLMTSTIASIIGFMTYELCIVLTLLGVSSSMESGFGICLVLVENYLSVRGLSSPAGFSLTVRTAQICILSFWAFMTVLILTYIFTTPGPTSSITGCEIQEDFYTHTFYVTLLLYLLLILVVMLILMGQMMLIVHRSLKNLFQGEGAAVDQLKQRSMQKKAKLSTLFIIIALGFVASWGPLAIGLSIDLVYPDYFSKNTFKIFTFFLPVNPCINVVVYSIKDKNFRTVCSILLRCKVGQVNDIGTSTTTG